ncbi:putative hydrolase of the HAD superfamily [Pseudoalteromonas rubra]|uniref:Putative hydrolase of the HAD superfamily n=1 Tax=Pseudoalteromonas rubra TaxID=43658 RepID=A0A8T0CA10_9GAMM|nr:HAD-IA family hydrolase [Pseudoalteromonas rubra]KAF7787567.1 putative hydrolase of the HAD superfamily [Pseudoalteromonas rubra]
MRFNRAIDEIQVLSFDLDDTLYNNHPVIAAAVKAMNDYVNALAPWRAQGPQFWLACRQHVASQHPELTHDVTRWRQVALRYGLQKAGFSASEIDLHAKAAYQAFAIARSQIVVDASVLALLARLRKRFRLIAITNGNVEVDRFNLADQFECVLMAGRDGRAKPHADLFEAACQQCAVAPHQLLHIGDSLDTDVQGANLAGCRSVWLNNQDTSYRYQGLADLEISDIHALSVLAN